MVSSTDFLVDDAYKRVWCSPGQDRQHIVSPTRITGRSGEIGNFKLGLKQYNLPTVQERYHVFTVGDLPPDLVGMATIPETWVNARGHCINTSLLIDLYTGAGVHLPLHQSYFLYTRNGDLVIAIKRSKNIIVDLALTPLYVRWRSNAYFDGATDIPSNQGIEVEGITYTDQPSFSLFQAKWRKAKQAKGYAWAFVNGRRVKDINVVTAKVGDILEYVRDASVKEVLEIKTKDLRSFDSLRDRKGKYLLPRPGLGDVIDYVDDVDVYVLNYKQAQAYDGLYYHQNYTDALRMVTHRDYSIPSVYLRGLVEAQRTWIWNDDLRVEVIVRHSGWRRPLADEAHRIKELFKLPENRRLEVMLGEESGVTVWRAANLEDSEYVKLMGAEAGTITRANVEAAYGYNAISRLIGDTPLKTKLPERWVELAYSLTANSTVYEYDKAGRLLGWYIHDMSIEYPLRNANCAYIEPYVGRGGVGLCTVYDQKETPLNPVLEYRFYVCDIRNGVSKNNWRDVTGNNEFYEVKDGKVVWKVETARYHTAVKNDLNFLAHTLNLDYRDDLLTVTIRVEEVRPGLVPTDSVMDIPPGELDVFLNGWGLIEDLDYYVAWPQICIVNKTRLVEGSQQQVSIRGRGFCKANLSRDVDREWGFVQYQKLSHNAQFNVRDDKVSRIIIGGALYTRDEVKFSEDGAMIGITVNNGVPYQISHPIIPMMGVTDHDAYELRGTSREIDEEIAGYLNLHLPEPVETQPDALPGMYPVFSPFVTKLVYDMLNGILTMDEYLRQDYSDDYLRERLAGYDWILQYDPARKDVDTHYVTIHPHPEAAIISLNVYQYRLLDRAIRIFLDNKVLLNRHFVIVEEGFEHDQRDHPHPHRTYAEVGEA